MHDTMSTGKYNNVRRRIYIHATLQLQILWKIEFAVIWSLRSVCSVLPIVPTTGLRKLYLRIIKTNKQKILNAFPCKTCYILNFNLYQLIYSPVDAEKKKYLFAYDHMTIFQGVNIPPHQHFYRTVLSTFSLWSDLRRGRSSAGRTMASHSACSHQVMPL